MTLLTIPQTAYLGSIPRNGRYDHGLENDGLGSMAFVSNDEGGDGHGEHASYDAESLRRAITRGLDPADESLDQAMPRWSMSP